MTPEQLPSWNDCVAAMVGGRETALELLVYKYEPPTPELAYTFRVLVAAALCDAESAAVRRHLEAEGPKPTKRTESDERLDELERRLDTMSRALAGVEAMNRRLLELERMHGLTIARAH